MSVVIHRSTSDALDRVMAFFGIDEYNRPLFSSAAQVAGVEAFSKTIEALDGAIKVDSRNGVTRRVRERIELEKEIRRNAEYQRKNQRA